MFSRALLGLDRHQVFDDASAPVSIAVGRLPITQVERDRSAEYSRIFDRFGEGA